MRRLPISLYLLLSSSYAAGGEASCTYVPDSEAPAVSACDDGERYVFDVTGVESAYTKADYQERLNQMLSDWLVAARLEPSADATVELWLAVPEANPAAAQARAVLKSRRLNLVWFLSLHPDEWLLGDRDVGILDGDAYPRSFGHRPRQILVKADGDDEEARHALLARHGATDPEPYTSGWSVYRTAAGSERSVADAVLRDPASRGAVARIETNHVVEWIAVRALAFTFAFSPVSP